MSQFRKQTVTFCSQFNCKTFQEKCLVVCVEFLNKNKALSLDGGDKYIYDENKYEMIERSRYI